MERADQRSGIQQQRPVGQGQIALLNRPQILPGNARLSDGPRAQVQQFVTIILYLREQLSDAGLRPVLPDDRQNVTENVGPGSIES